MTALHHVSSTRNRESIRAHGLDWTRMGDAPGIAGSGRPEVEGCYLCEDGEEGFFLGLNNTGGPVDLWAVDGVDPGELLRESGGFAYLPRTVPPDAVRLVRADVPQPVRRP